MLTIRNLSTLDLGPVNLEVGTSQSISINGPSGSGKSILLRAIADLDPHKGEVRSFDIDQNDVSGPAWRQQVSLLHTDSAFWEETALQHFSEQDRDEVDSYCEQLELSPDALQQPLNRLSNGEKQRIALIRLLVNKPRTILLDESTSHLDPDSKQRAEHLILSYQQQYQSPIIWVSHDEYQRRRVADKHYEIQDGGLVEVSL